MSTRIGRSGAFAQLAVVAAVAALLLMPAAVHPVRAYGPLPCTIDPIANQTVAEGDVVEVVFHAANPNPYPYDAFSLSIGPPAVAAFATLIDNSNGTWTLRIAPNDGDAGTYMGVGVTTSSTNDLHTTSTFDITVTHANRPPVLDLIPPQTVAEGATLNVELTATDPDNGDHITISKDTLPAFATLTDHGDGTATITLAPGYSDAGTYSDQTVDVYDGTSYGAQVAFDITVTNTNRPPVLDPIADQTVAEGATKDVAISATDPDGDHPLVITGTMPAFATLTDHHDGTATIHLAPGYAAAGSYPSVPVTVDDGHSGSGGRTFDITVTNTDTAAPVVTVPDHKNVEATGPSGAAVSYSASASDDIDGPITPACAPISGSTFGLGHTTVTCSATDSDGHTGSASFVVTVTDTTPPDITEPGGDPLPDISAQATSPSGARVTFTAGATDAVDSSVVTTCRPASGHRFPIGTTRVTCTATDAAGNTGSVSFHVTVTGSSQPKGSMPETSTTAPANGAPRDAGSVPLVLLAALGSLTAAVALQRRRRASR